MKQYERFQHSLVAAKSSFYAGSELSFRRSGKDICFGSVTRLSDRQAEISLSIENVDDPGYPTVLGLVCFLADVSDVDLFCDLSAIAKVLPENRTESFIRLLESASFLFGRMKNGQVPLYRLSRSIHRVCLS